MQSYLGLKLRILDYCYLRNSYTSVGKVVKQYGIKFEVVHMFGKRFPGGPSEEAGQVLRRVEPYHIAVIDRYLFDYEQRVFGYTDGWGILVSGVDLQPVEAEKALLHEIGHLLGVGHCTNDCVMKLAHPRNVPMSYCAECERFIKEVMGV